MNNEGSVASEIECGDGYIGSILLSVIAWNPHLAVSTVETRCLCIPTPESRSSAKADPLEKKIPNVSTSNPRVPGYHFGLVYKVLYHVIIQTRLILTLKGYINKSTHRSSHIHTTTTMPPKQQRVVVERADRRRPNSAPKGYIGQVYGTLTAPENASVVRSIAIFGVSEDLTMHRV